jgi:sulfur-oxidizing protein SoxY
MRSTRRDILKAGLKAGAGLSLTTLLAPPGWLRPGGAAAQAAWNKAAFEAKSMTDALRALDAGSPAPSAGIGIQSPDIAENGAVVPITVTSTLPKTEGIAILVEKNPNMLAAVFELLPGTEPSVTTRVKMGQTSNVHVLVKADGKFYAAVKEIKVTLGGCGG